MQGLMQDRPLTLDHFFNRAETIFAKKEVVTATATGIERETYGAVGRAVAATRRRARRPRHLGRRPGRHLRLEHRPPPRAVVRRAVQRSGAAHAEHPAVPRAGHLHRQPRRGRGDLRRPVADRPAVAAARHVRDRAPHRGHGRRPGRGAQPRRRPRPPRLRGPAGRGRPGRVAPARREPGRVDVLHERHHRQPQGRRLLAPLDLAAHRRRDDGRQPRRLRARHDPAGRADVPRQRLGPGPRRRGLRRQPGDARARPVARRPSPTSSSTRRSPWRPACPPSGWACCPSSRAATRRTCGPSRAAARRCPATCPRPTARPPACRSCRPGA